MSRILIHILLILTVVSASCSARKNKLETKNLIPEKELISLLTDIHIADGLLALPRINAKYSSLDSISTYYLIIEKHGYTKERFENTMKYYFIKNPKRLNKIYDQVLGNLSEMDTRVQKESFQDVARNANLWRGNEFYAMPSRGNKDSTAFGLRLPKAGFYTLAFTVTLYPDDQSFNPEAYVYSVSADSADSGKRRYLKSVQYLKDGRPHLYYLTLNVSENANLYLGGWLLYYENRHEGTWTHFIIDNISLTVSSPPA
jgi:hypothetical protein